ncbi:MAG: GNAT family N-acetyltransferase [Acetatifactor sp.]|nr:GNAT family N-acetyltransferase [Acetatifactor sp.]
MIRYATEKDFELLSNYDKHICETELKNCIKTERILLMFHNDVFIGWLRYNLFWDNIPFMNMLYFLEDYRGKGYGSQLVNFWEKEMLKSKYKMVLTSTQSNEQAQFFYRKIGYVDCGSLLLPEEPLEIILLKHLG